MQHIDAPALASLPPRIAYLTAFIGFTSADAAALHAAQPAVAALVPSVVAQVYRKLLAFDITAQSFVPRQTGYDGAAPAALRDLSLEHPQIRFRMDFLKMYLLKLTTMDYELASTWEYLDKVAVMHTGVAGFAHRAKKPALRVEYMHMGLLLGYVMDILLAAIVEHPGLDGETKSGVLRAFNKVIWIQNDLFARRYVAPLTQTQTAKACDLRGVAWGVAGVVLAGGLQTLYRRWT